MRVNTYYFCKNETSLVMSLMAFTELISHSSLANFVYTNAILMSFEGLFYRFWKSHSKKEREFFFFSDLFFPFFKIPRNIARRNIVHLRVVCVCELKSHLPPQGSWWKIRFGQRNFNLHLMFLCFVVSAWTSA